jgi:hypothetical protein
MSRSAFLTVFLVLLATLPLAAVPTPEGIPTVAASISSKTAGMERRDGLLPIWIDRKAGRVWLEVPAPKPGSDEVGSYLYADTLRTGLGSNPVGLDRGQLGIAAVITLRRVGGRLLVEQPNLGFRALSQNPAEIQAVRESFATSVVWAGPIAAEDSDGRALVDLTGFLVRDAHYVVAKLKETGQGSWQLDPERSVPDLDNCLAFPENLELEALLTYASPEPGPLVTRTAPLPGAMTLVQHHSLVKLPDAGYQPRAYDPRAGSYAVTFNDYAAPLDAPIDVRWIARHRLEKVDPAAERSRVKKPIVYYVDPGAPEPIRTALIEGASWWREAFDKAGFVDAFRVEVLPPGASLMDIRYNVIQWVHRSTRGWSYGGGIIDPRTGEVVKGRVILGSLRVRQDRLIFEGLSGTEKTGSGAADDPVQLALWRIRQLAAHEVGHSLGLAHNFAASTYGRASVMDYPAPLVGVTPGGDLDFSKAYGTGAGEWDVFAIRWAYGQHPPGANEAAAQDALVRDALKRGLVFLTDEDARPAGAAHSRAVLWDNGSDVAEALRQALAVRRIALSRFGEHNIPAGRPLALLQEVLAPIYFYHRYQLDGALKAVGGLDYSYALRGDDQTAVKPLDGEVQRKALAAVLDAMEPAALDLPESILAVLPPRPAGYEPNPEMFPTAAAPAFDPLAAASAAADMAVQGLLQPERAARLVDFHRRDPKLPGFEEVLDALTKSAFAASQEEPRRAELRRTLQWVVVRRLIGLAGDPEASAGVRSRAEGALRALRNRLGAEDAHRAFLAGEIGRFLERPIGPPGDTARLPAPPEPPPGQPIGSATLGLSDCSWGG